MSRDAIFEAAEQACLVYRQGSSVFSAMRESVDIAAELVMFAELVRADLLLALQAIVDCISETRGKDATDVVANARALLDCRTPAADAGGLSDAEILETAQSDEFESAGATPYCYGESALLSLVRHFIRLSEAHRRAAVGSPDQKGGA